MREHINVINELEGLEFLRVSLEEIGMTWNLADKLLLELNLMLEELCSNYINHAEAARNSFIEIQLVSDEELLTITVKDRGKQFNPTKVPAADINLSIDQREPGGLGLHFIKHYSDSVDYTRKDGVNIVTITKKINST